MRSLSPQSADEIILSDLESNVLSSRSYSKRMPTPLATTFPSNNSLLICKNALAISTIGRRNHSFRSGVKCLIVQIILEKNANAFSDDVSIQQLVAHLQECARYLHNRQTKSFFQIWSQMSYRPDHTRKECQRL